MGVLLCSCGAGIHVRPSPSVSQASTCRADVSQVGTSPQGLRSSPFPSEPIECLQEGFVFPRFVGHPIEPPSCILSGPKFFRSNSFNDSELCGAAVPGCPSEAHVPSESQHAPSTSGAGRCGSSGSSRRRSGSLHDSPSVTQAGHSSASVDLGPPSGGPCPASPEDGYGAPTAQHLNAAELFSSSRLSRARGREPTATPAKHKSKLISRCPVERFLEKYGSRFQRPVSGWLGMLNLSAYKALHPTWNQEPDLLHLAEGLEEQCQEGTLEHWALGRALQASEARDHTPETWARIARASEDLVYSVSRGKPRAFKFVSANVTSWRPEIRQWLVSQHFDVALIQEHHLSEKSFQAESVALSKAGYHVHGQHAPARKREVGGVMVCAKSHLQARHVHTFRDLDTGCGFVGIAVRLAGFDLALFSLYLESGSTFDGQVNTSVLSHLYAVIAALQCPWCVAGDWNLDASEVLATRLEDLTKGRLLGTGLPTAGTATELDYALAHPRLASHLSLELAWDVPFKPHAALVCHLPLKPLLDLQPNLKTINDSFDPITDEQRKIHLKRVSPQKVTLLELEAYDAAYLAFARFSATAEATGSLGSPSGRGVDLPTVRQPAVSQAPDSYQWFGQMHSIWSQLEARLKNSPERLALRAEASQQARGLAPLTFEQVKAACLGTGNKKGGLDGWSYRALRNLPDACYQQLAELFRSVELELAMPLQMRAVQVALLPKSPEKERPISLTSVLWRIFSKLRRHVLDGWMKEYVAHAPFDAATPGRTCLDPALSRLIKAEDHKFRKVTFVTLFVDLLGYFSRLLQQGSALSFPPLLLELSLQLYTGPRCLNGEGVSTVMLHPKRGILQGCPYAPTIAKLTTHAPLQAISSEPGVSGADLWLDDITVDISHPDPEVAAAHALSVSRKLDYLLSIEKLQINKAKTKFVVNNAQAAKALNTMRGADDPEVTDLVRDLGVDSAGAKRRRVTHALKRFKVGRARNVKLHALATGGKAHRLYATSVLTAEIFGHQAQGLSPKRLKVIRASISRHVGRSRWGSVDVSLDSMSFRCQDPLLTVILAQADTLYKMFGPSTLQGWEVLSRTWRVAWNRQHAAVHGWKCVAGPVAAMIQYCLDLSIDVSDPLRWVHGGGVLSLDVTDPGLFLSVRRFLTKVVALERAARFGAVPTANGAQEGVDWTVHRRLLKSAKTPSPKWAFHAVWQGRVLHSGNGGCPLCACGAENSLHHVYYDCPLSPGKLSLTLRGSNADTRIPASGCGVWFPNPGPPHPSLRRPWKLESQDCFVTSLLMPLGF